MSVGYFWARNYLVINIFITKFIKNSEYKATILSVKSQISLLIQVVVSFGIGFVMNYSYKLGYLTLGLIMFFLLSLLYPRIKIYLT